MTEYCAVDPDLKDRLTPLGYKFVVDRDNDGAINTIEIRGATSAIEWAGSLIDEAITAKRLITAILARAGGSTILKHLCVDLAAYRAAGHGGRKIPQSLKDAYEDARERLDLYSDGMLVDDLEYPNESDLPESRHPRAINPFRRIRRRRIWRR